MSKAQYAIEAEGLTKVFGDNKALDNLSIKVPKGSIYGVLGPNGAGKSTMINILATLLKPDAGQATIFGYDVLEQPQIVRQLIGVTGQFASVDETMSAVENLVIFGQLLGLTTKEAHKKATKLLEDFGLTEAAKRPLKKFSGGMRRRLDLAASLLASPPLIFLDEPTTGLDPRTRTQMWHTIRKLVADGSTVLLTTQYLDEADQLADRIAIIDRGTVVAEDTPDGLKNSIGNETLILTVKDADQTEAAEKIAERITKTDVKIINTRQIIVPIADSGLAIDLLIALRKAKIGVKEFKIERPTLDEVFLSITGKKPKTEAKENENDN
ncbi:MAG: ATP-binding cassette domain-containing protein [Candidatus Nomurabacteria bacterium]|jgi:ABC-2 type transport system ATP-binding protein|nr:ATP-binding cassette domain-containing protein [Candidatus Nomurabacteria bacterium]